MCNCSLRFPLMAGTFFLFSTPGLQNQTAQSGIAWWVWLIIILLAILIVWWLISRQAKNRPPEDEIRGSHTESPPVATPAPHEIVEEMRPAPPVEAAQVFPVKDDVELPASTAFDDLVIIEGIGPKINAVLQAAGINTFAQLASTEPARLQQILDNAGLRLADPTTWPEQARLAASGDWDGLKKLTESLKGGRNVTPNI